MTPWKVFWIILCTIWFAQYASADDSDSNLTIPIKHQTMLFVMYPKSGLKQMTDNFITTTNRTIDDIRAQLSNVEVVVEFVNDNCDGVSAVTEMMQRVYKYFSTVEYQTPANFIGSVVGIMCNEVSYLKLLKNFKT